MTKDEALRLALEALKKSKNALAEELAAWDIDPPLHHVLEAHDACEPAIKACEEALAQPKPETVPIPKGMVLIPKSMTKAMLYVTEQQDWTWEDFLAAAEAITEDEYNEIAAAPEMLEVLREGLYPDHPKVRAVIAKATGEKE